MIFILSVPISFLIFSYRFPIAKTFSTDIFIVNITANLLVTLSFYNIIQSMSNVLDIILDFKGYTNSLKSYIDNSIVLPLSLLLAFVKNLGIFGIWSSLLFGASIYVSCALFIVVRTSFS